MQKTYRSAVDAWLLVLLIGIPLGLIAAGVFRLGAAPKQGAFFIIEGVFVGGFVTLLCVPCVYTIAPEQLHVRCGVQETTVPLDKIDRVELSNSLWSAPALSLKRVRIDYGSESVVISPRQREAFIAELQAAVAARRGGAGPATRA